MAGQNLGMFFGGGFGCYGIPLSAISETFKAFNVLQNI